MPQNMKSSDRFRTVSNSAVIFQLIPPPYIVFLIVWKVPNNDGEFEWSITQQGQILGALFYGNIISQIPAGILAEIVGGKLIFSLGILASSIVTLFTPMLAYQSYISLIISRALVGFAQVSSRWYNIGILGFW